MQVSMGSELNSTSVGARRTLASFARYAGAQRAVDKLADLKFPVERVAIVAEGLKVVEQVTGRLTYGRDEVAGEAIQLLGLSPGAPASGGPIPQPA